MNLPEIEYNNYNTREFEKDVSIDRTNLDEEFATHAEKFAYYAFCAAEARYLSDLKKSEFKHTESVVYMEFRTNAMLSSLKVTEAICEHEVRKDSRYKTALEESQKAELKAQQLEGAVKAMSQKKDMLMQMGASARVAAVPPRILAAQEEQVRDIITRNRNQQGE